MEQDEIIRRFVAEYNQFQSAQYQIARRPDKEKENRRSRACDAYAEASNARPLAIEHTNVLTFHDQKQDSARFLGICGALENELKDAFRCNFSLIIPVFAIQPRTDWNKIKETLREWLLTNVNNLPPNRSDHQVVGVPFLITIWKDSGKGFRVSRWAPPDIEAELVEITASALVDKNDQLSEYRAAGAETVLILESDDMALVNWPMLYRAFLAAYQCVPTPNIDQVWMAFNYEERGGGFYFEIRCFLGPESIMDRVNPSNALFGPRYSEYWASEIEKNSLLQKGIIALGQQRK